MDDHKPTDHKPPCQKQNELLLKPIAYITTDFPEKFGVPRQSGLAKGTVGHIEFIKGICGEEAVRGLEEFSHIWLLWGFSENKGEWHETVRPPRLGGEERKGVFATRSPLRPNPIGLSSVRLLKILKGPVLEVEAPDLVSGTPIYDIKPYVPYADSHPDASQGFTSRHADYTLNVSIPDQIAKNLPESTKEAIVSLLSQDPRPAYHSDPERIYGMSFRSLEIKFRVSSKTAEVLSVTPRNPSQTDTT